MNNSHPTSRFDRENDKPLEDSAQLCAEVFGKSSDPCSCSKVMGHEGAHHCEECAEGESALEANAMAKGAKELGPICLNCGERMLGPVLGIGYYCPNAFACGNVKNINQKLDTITVTLSREEAAEIAEYGVPGRVARACSVALAQEQTI